MTFKVSDVGEKELVKYIISKSSNIVPDDTAITEFRNTNLISTCDMLIQSRHFPEAMSYYEMGFKAVTVNVSDLAAMAAEPFGFLLAIGFPMDLEVSSFKQVIDGVLDGCDYYNIPLIGGDTNQSDEIIIAGTALGVCESPVLKNTYCEGDLVCLTGSIGLAALGFNMPHQDNIYTKHALKPVARLKESLILKDYLTSATDITDGVASELYEIKRDDYGFMIYEDKLEITDEFKEFSQDLGLNYLDLILYVGEDFELLFTIDSNDLDKIPIDIMVIGEVTKSGKVEMTLSDLSVLEVKNKGYEHYVSK